MLTTTPVLDPERLFGRFALLDRQAVIVAISGGSDSTALLLLLHHHFSHHGRADRLHAVTVDHALRPASAAEAHDVAVLCAERGIDHRTMIWSDDKPATGIAAAARAARYRLLQRAADDIGADVILTGHTEDDQAETLAMRGARGGGIGMAGMAPDTLLDGRIWLLRPLLDISRQTLRNHLRVDRVGWIDDPSNASPDSERVRVRQAMGPAERMWLLNEARGAARERVKLGSRAAAHISHTLSAEGERVRVSPRLFQTADRDAAIHAVRLLLAVLGQGEHLPDFARSEALFDGLSQQGFTASLAGCVVAHRRPGITVRREQRGGDHREGAPVTTMFRDRPVRPIIPGFDLPAYRALTKLFCAPEIPASPLS